MRSNSHDAQWIGYHLPTLLDREFFDRSLRSPYRWSDGVRDLGAAVQYLSQGHGM
jgi:hypothetical protein